MITYEQRQQIEELKKKYEDIIEVFHPEDKGERLRELEEESLKPDFWTDQRKHSKLTGKFG